MATDYKTHNQVIDSLEALVDSNSVRYVLEALAEVCSAKADHIRSNWQDEKLAKAWDAEAGAILSVASKSRLVG